MLLVCLTTTSLDLIPEGMLEYRLKNVLAIVDQFVLKLVQAMAPQLVNPSLKLWLNHCSPLVQAFCML